MQTTILTYLNQEYQVHILSSTDREPHFHWVLFKDPSILAFTGGEDNVCFQQLNGELVCSSLVLKIKAPLLVDTAKKLIAEYLKEPEN